MKSEKLILESEKHKFRKFEGITLISLVIAIVLLIILAGIGINLSLGENGLFNKAKYAKNFWSNSQIEETLMMENLVAQMDEENSRNEEIEIIEVQTSEFFENYNEYVDDSKTITIQKYDDILFYTLATNSNIPSKIWTTIGTLKEEYRPKADILYTGSTGGGSACTFTQILMDGSVSVYQSTAMELRSIVTLIYPTNNNSVEVIDAKYNGIFESYNNCINSEKGLTLQKYNNMLFYSLTTEANIPSKVWTTIGVLKEEYRPKSTILVSGTNGGASACTFMQITPNGSVSVYQSSGNNQRSTANFVYPINNNQVEVKDTKHNEIFESCNNYINDERELTVQKYNNMLFYTLTTETNIPSKVWTTIGVLKEEYRPKTTILVAGTNGNASACTYMQITADGNVSVYQSTGSNQQSTATFIYPID